jgi:hypothetical protein
MYRVNTNRDSTFKKNWRMPVFGEGSNSTESGHDLSTFGVILEEPDVFIF